MAVTASRTFVFAAALMACSGPAYAAAEDWHTASDVARAGLVAAAAAVPSAQEDWEGAKQAAFSVGGAFVVTQGLKSVIGKERPDNSGDDSFPSGHASTSFAAAATLHRRYGWEVGVPAHVVATFVAVARVEADKHFVEDVLVGAVIGEASGWIFTKPANANVQWLPWASTKGGGVTVAARF